MYSQGKSYLIIYKNYLISSFVDFDSFPKIAKVSPVSKKQ